MLPKESAHHVLETIMAMYPDARPTMRYDNPFQLLVVVILSAQATDASVDKVTEAFFKRYPDPYAIIESNTEEIESYIKTIGLYRNKAKYIFQSSLQLIDHFDGQVPHSRKELLTLSGIGQKSANILLSVAFEQNAFAVDTHVTRICKHHNIVDEGATVKEIEERITEILPAERWGHCHQAMINFGREICKARNPLCLHYPELYLHLEEEV